MDTEATNPRKKWIIISSVIVLVILLALTAYLSMQNGDTTDTVTTNATPTSSVSSAPTATPVGKTKTYFATGTTLTDVASGTSQAFTPAGYTINGPGEYPTFPTYLVLEKDKQLYAYTIATKEIRKINIAPTRPSTDTFSEYAAVSTSINDKTKAYIVIRTFEGNESEFGDAPPTSAKAYFYDFTTNTVTAAQDNNLPTGTASKCYEYDSLFTRFFTWPCGEGIGSATPLATYDYSTKTTKEVVSGNTLFLRTTDQKNNFLVFNYDSGLASQINTITQVKADKKDITQEVYTVADAVKPQIKDTGYGALLVAEKGVIALGGSNSVTLLSFNASKQITAATILPEPEIYANSLFSDKEKLYYVSNDKIQVVDLTSKKITKSIAAKKDVEVGLIALPE